MFVYSMLIILAYKGETNWNCIPVLYVCMDILYIISSSSSINSSHKHILKHLTPFTFIVSISLLTLTLKK